MLGGFGGIIIVLRIRGHGRVVGDLIVVLAGAGVVLVDWTWAAGSYWILLLCCVLGGDRVVGSVGLVSLGGEIVVVWDHC